ncbi:hypothetical protein OBRU01_15968 [Operophtera brumata]|uniref:Uncharacterized protein n=1 Tax=Operophtera brumata TaxID=104452 RepID=A0A0L7KX57_OPEBR|nr:hypothetical protein OBRU01_15968 [Operophtera brumata]
MEHAKKMVLIDPSVIEKINQHNTVDSPISRLDTEMQKNLKSNIEDRKKCILYLQILQRYLHFTAEGRHPIELPIVSNIEVSDSVGDNSGYDTVDNKNKEIDVKDSVAVQTSSEDEEQENNTASNSNSPYSSNNILSLIPKTYVRKGEILLFLLSSNNNKIHWDGDGTITVDKEKIHGSNIVDLVNDTLRPLKRSDPIGWQKFAKIYIGNPKISDFIKQLRLKEDNERTPHNERTPQEREPFSTPIARPKSIRIKSVRTAKPRIDWEKWSPY